MPETRSNNTLTELNTRNLTLEEMVQRQSLVNERIAANLERIFGVLEKLQEDWTTERRAEKQPMKSPSSPMILTPKSESEPLTTCLDMTVESVESASTEIELASIDVKDKSDLAIATGVFEDDDLDVSTIDSTQTEVTFDLFSADFSSVFVSSNAIIGEESFETKFCVSNIVSDLCLLLVCENDSANALCLFVTRMAFVGNWCCIQPLVSAAKPPPKPPDAFVNMLGQINQVLSIVSKISCDMFKSMVCFTWSSKKDVTSTRCLVFVGLFVSVYVIELSRSQMALTKCAKSDVSAPLVVVAPADSIDEYGTNINVGLKKGEKDEISYYVQQGGNNQWLSTVSMRSESKLLYSVRLERATYNTQWVSRLQTNVVSNELCKMIGPGKPSFAPKNGKTSVVIFVSLRRSRKTTTCTRIGIMQGLSSGVLLMEKPSGPMSHGVFRANAIISTLPVVVSESLTYWLFQKVCICKRKIVAELYIFSKPKDKAMVIIKGRNDDRFLLSFIGIHCKSLGHGCRQAMEQYHIFTNGLGMLGKSKILFMPLDEADKFFHNQSDVLCTSPTGQQPTQGAVYESNNQQTEFLTIELCVSVKSDLVGGTTVKKVIVVEDIIEDLDALNTDISTDLILVSTRTLSVSEFVDLNTNTLGETIKKYSGNCPFEFGLSNDVMVQGCYTVLKAFTENMDMRLNLEVTKIYYGSDKVMAMVEEGRILVAHTLVITTSLGFLEAYLIEFEPKLLEWKIAAISDGGNNTDAEDSKVSTDKTRMQLFLDIQEYGRNLSAFGVKATKIPSYILLWKCVAPSDKQDKLVMALIDDTSNNVLTTLTKSSLMESIALKRMSSPLASFYQGMRIFGDKVERVVVLDRIVNLPYCVIMDEYGWAKDMRIIKALALRDSSLVVYLSNKKTIVIHPENSIEEGPRKRFDAEKDCVMLLFGSVLVPL